MPDMCPMHYDRPIRVKRGRGREVQEEVVIHQIRCTFLEGHTGAHSFDELRRADRGTATAEQAQTIQLSIRDGHFDEHIELLLSALHDRKRELNATRRRFIR